MRVSTGRTTACASHGRIPRDARPTLHARQLARRLFPPLEEVGAARIAFTLRGVALGDEGGAREKGGSPAAPAADAASSPSPATAAAAHAASPAAAVERAPATTAAGATLDVEPGLAKQDRARGERCEAVVMVLGRRSVGLDGCARWNGVGWAGTGWDEMGQDGIG